jgi:integrase
MASLRRDKGSGDQPRWIASQDRWRARFTHPDTGKRVAVYSFLKGRAGARQCAERRDAALAAVDDALDAERAAQTLAQFLERWLETVARPNLRPRSFERYEGIVRRYLVPELGAVKLGRLRTRHIADLYASLRLPRTVTITHARSVRTVERAMSAASLRYLHAVLHGALSQAVEWRIIASNPADRVRLPAKTGEVMTPLAPDQVPTFLEAIRNHPLEAVFTLAIATGMRQGEILGLRWRDLDGRRLHVRHTLVRMNGGWWLGDPKTPQSRRTIELTDPTVKVLRAHRRRRAKHFLRLGHRLTADDLIFTDDGGMPLHGRHLTERHLRPLLREAGLPEIRFHDLRHTYATLQLAVGTNPKLVAEVLGHKDVGITLDRYSHSQPAMQREAAERLDALLGRSPG